MPSSYQDQRSAVVAASRLLVDAGVLSHSGHGNASLRLPDQDLMLLTSISNLSNLEPGQMAVVGIDGSLREGPLEASSAEVVKMHTAVYEMDPGVGAVIHTHSPRATTFALAHQALPCCYEALLRFGVREDIPVAAWGPRGSQESISNIVDTLSAHRGTPAVLLANHGVLAFGPDIATAARLVIAMEEAADMSLAAMALGGAQPFTTRTMNRMREPVAALASA
ncbi:MAG: class II aldolase/adducin family protein [Chloroflexota bacterium]